MKNETVHSAHITGQKLVRVMTYDGKLFSSKRKKKLSVPTMASFTNCVK